MEAEEPVRVVTANELNRKLMRVACQLLDMASDKYSDHGCNDWAWPEYLTANDRLAVARMMYADKKRKSVPELTAEENEDAAHMVKTGPPDWWMMSFLSKRLAQAITTDEFFEAFVAGFYETAEGYNGEFYGKKDREDVRRELRVKFDRWLKSRAGS